MLMGMGETLADEGGSGDKGEQRWAGERDADGRWLKGDVGSATCRGDTSGEEGNRGLERGLLASAGSEDDEFDVSETAKSDGIDVGGEG